jgi:hypothetical protein
VSARSGLVAAALIAGVIGMGSALAQDAVPALPETPPAPFKPDADTAAAPAPQGSEDTWIFSGALSDSHETFSGTLVTGKTSTDFEFKLAGGATCTGGSLAGEPGLVRLSEITCSDDRKMRALFVPQGGVALKVFGHVGEQRFAASAHLLGTEAIPEKKQTAAPKAPDATPPAPALPAPTPSRRPRDG